MKQPSNNAPFPNDLALQILTLLRRGDVSRWELAQQLNPRRSRKALTAHLQQLERLQLVVRDSTGPTDRWWIDADVVLSMSDRVARCAEGLTQLDKAFVRRLSPEMKEVLNRRKLFNSTERVLILEEIAQAPRGIDYIWNMLSATVSKTRIVMTLNVFEASGLATEKKRRAQALPGFGNELEFRATRLGVEIAELLRWRAQDRKIQAAATGADERPALSQEADFARVTAYPLAL
jgi:hypothetical protein